MTEKIKYAVYVGKDEGYWRNLQGYYTSTHKDTTFEFVSFFEENKTKIESIIAKLLLIMPDFIFLDYSTHGKEMLNLAKLIRKMSCFDYCAVVGLLDYLLPRHMIEESVCSGVNLNHIKSAEISDVVWDAFMLAFPKEAKKDPRAEGKVNEDLDCKALFKIGYVTGAYLHVETDWLFKAGEVVELETNLSPNFMIQRFRVSKANSENLFYHYDNSYNLEYDFAIDENSKLNIAKQVQLQKNKIVRWIEDTQDNTFPKDTRILIVDKQLKQFKTEFSKTFNSPYSIRYHNELDKNLPMTMRRVKAAIIAIQLDTQSMSEIADNEKEKKKTKDALIPGNNIENLQHLINCISQIKEYKPFVLVYNTTHTSQALQETLKYPKIMVDPGVINYSKISHLAKAYQEKVNKAKMTVPKGGKKPEKRLVIKNNDPRSFAEKNFSVSVLTMTESAMTFGCDLQLPDYTSLEFTKPVEYYGTIIPSGDMFLPDCDKKYTYYALVNALGENEKKELRQFVNSTFFKDKDAKRQQELNEFKAKNQKIANERNALKKDKEDQQNAQNAVKMAKAKAIKEASSGSDDPKKK